VAHVEFATIKLPYIQLVPFSQEERVSHEVEEKAKEMKKFYQ